MNVGISTFRIFIMYVFISDMLPTLYHYKPTTPMFSAPFRPSLDQNILISKNKTAFLHIVVGRLFMLEIIFLKYLVFYFLRPVLYTIYYI